MTRLRFSHPRHFYSRFLAILLSAAVLAGGTLSSFAEASRFNRETDFWKSRRMASRQGAPPMAQREDTPRNRPPIVTQKNSSPNWFEVDKFFPLFGPTSWHRDRTTVPYVTMIQDAHNNFAAQLSLEKSLVELAQKDKPLLVCVEGAWGPLDVDLSEAIRDPEKRKETATDLLERGIINGEEHLVLTSPSGLLDIVGVDDPGLHKKNSLARELVETWGQSTQDRVKSFRSSLNVLKQDVYPPSLVQLDAIVRKYQQDKLSAPQMARALRPLASARWWDTRFPNMARAALMETTGGSSSPEQFQKEMANYLNTLSAPEAARMAQVATQDFAHFIEIFQGPALLGKRLTLIQAQRQLSLTALSRELEKVPRILLDHLLASENQTSKTTLSRRIAELDQWATLADRLVQLKMTPEDWSDFNQSPFQSINDAVQEMSHIAHSAGTALPPEPRVNQIHEKITWEAANAFYRLAKSRDAAMVTNTLAEARKRNKTNVVLIAGGFHTPGMTRLLKQNRTYNKTICPVFSMDPVSPAKRTLRRMSFFQTPESKNQLLELAGINNDNIPHAARSQEERKKVGVPSSLGRWPSLRRLGFEILLVAISVLFTQALFAAGVDPHVAILAYTAIPLSDPFLQRMLDPKHEEPTPSDQLAQNQEKIESLKSAITTAIDGGNPKGAANILMDVSSYSDERAFSIFFDLDDSEQKALLDVLGPPERSRLFNGYSAKRFREYLGDYQFLFEAIDQIKNNLSNLSNPEEIEEEIENANDAIGIIDFQIGLLEKLPNVSNDLPKLMPDNEPELRREYIDSVVRPFIEARQKEITLWNEILAHLEEKKTNPKVKNETLETQIEETRTLYASQYAKFKYFASGIYAHLYGNWARTLTRSGKRNDLRAYDRLSPSKGNRNEEARRVEKLERLGDRLGHGVDDLSERAQAYLESGEGASWSVETSPYKTMIHRVRSTIHPMASNRSVAAVLPSRFDKRSFVDDLARTLRSDKHPLKALSIEPLALMTSNPELEEISDILRSLLSEATARGDALLVVDVDAFQNQNPDVLLEFLKEWEKINNGPTPAPPLVLVCTERTHALHLQQEKIRGVFPPVVSAKDPKKPDEQKQMARASLNRALAPLFKKAGVTVSDGGLLDLCLNRLAAMNPFDLVDRAVDILGEVIERGQVQYFRGQRESVDIDRGTMEESLNKLPPFHLLPLRDRVMARAQFMPVHQREEVRNALAELEELRATNPFSSSIPSLMDRLEGLIRFPWVERARPLIPPELSQEDRQEKIKDIYRRIPGVLMKTHFGLGEVMDDIMDILTKTIQSDIASAPGSMEIPTFVGPPGVGKTTLLKTLGKLTGRPVYLVSMNMVNDVVDIKGTHKTFLHSKAGLIALTLVEGDPNAPSQGGVTGVKNPIFVLDEIDKATPAVQSAILDFVGEESKKFQDNNYGEVDISEVFFVATANKLGPLISPLLNRMKIIHLPGYTVNEKTAIGLRYTLPRVIRDLHISDDVLFENKADLVRLIAQGYAHEEGMRNMIRIIESVVSIANTRAVETGQPTVCNRKFVESILGPPQFRPQIPDADPIGEAYYPSQRGEINRVQASDSSLTDIDRSHLLSLRKPLNEVSEHVKLLLQARRNPWTEEIQHSHGLNVTAPALGGESPLLATFPKEGKRNREVPSPLGRGQGEGIDFDVPQLGSDEAVAELAFVIAGLSRMTGISVRRESVFVGTLDNDGNLLEDTDIRKRALTAYEAGARQLVIPSKNEDDLLSKTFSTIPALRGPVLERVPSERGEQWRLYLPNSYSKSMPPLAAREDSFEILTGTFEEMRQRAEAEAYTRQDGTRCLYILARNVQDALPFAYAPVNRAPFVLTHGPAPWVDQPVEDEEEFTTETAREIPETESPEDLNDSLAGYYSRYYSRLDERDFSDLLEMFGVQIRAAVSSGTLDETLIARIEGFIRYALTSDDPHQSLFLDYLYLSSIKDYQTLFSILSPEVFGNILFAYRQGLIVRLEKQWTDNLNAVRIQLDSLEANPKDNESFTKLKEILLSNEALPSIDEQGQPGDPKKLRAAVRALDVDNPTHDPEENLKIVIKMTKEMIPQWEWAIDLFSPAGVSTDNSAQSENLFRQMMETSGGLRFKSFAQRLEGTMDPHRVKSTWDAYAAADLLNTHLAEDNIQYVSPPTSPWDPKDPMEPVFGPAANRFTEVMARENSRSMVLIGCPPLLKSEWPPFLLRRLWTVGRPSRMIKLDVSKILDTDDEQTLWDILTAARTTGDTAVWIDLDELPDDLDPSILSVALHILSQGPRTTPLLFTGSESAHLKWLGQSPAYAQEVVPQSMVDADMGTLLRLEIHNRNQTTGFAMEESATDALIDSVRKNEISMPMARRILDRSLEFAGDDAITFDHIAQAKQAITLEDDNNLHWATLRERFDLVSPHMTAEARRTCQNLLSRLQTASRNEAGTIEKQLKYIINFPWNKRSKSTITRLPNDPTPEQVANLKKEIREGIIKLRGVLDETHYGMNIVKDRIVDYYVRNSISIAYTGKGIGKPLLLVSDPGIGKSSIVPPIAKGLGRTFSRLALGAVRDFRELIGFNSAYDKADAGKFLKSMKERDTVFLMDEIDKMEEGPSNNPFLALLSYVDLSQNSAVLDNYTGARFPYDECLFVATANTLKTIPEPLLDRFEVIRVPSYTENEKTAIGVQKVFPKLEKEWASGGLVKTGDLRPVIETLLKFIKEQGVRQLTISISNLIGRAVTMAHTTGTTFELTAESAAALLKRRPVQKVDRPARAVGRVNGLAVIEKEGLLLSIEADNFDTGGTSPFSHREIGQLGNMMRPSFTRALTYAKSRVDLEKLRGHVLSLFLSPIDIEKDGDSAGAAFGFAILSALMGIPVRQDVALTGMIDERGNIGQVGSIEGKVTAAINEGMREIFVPFANKKDLFNDVILNNGTTLSLFEDATDPTIPTEIRIPKPFWPTGTPGEAQQMLTNLAKAAGLSIDFSGGTALLTGTETQANTFFESNKNRFRKPPALVIYSHMTQIEDRVLDKSQTPTNTGTGLRMHGLFNVPLLTSFFGITALALGIPVWVGLDTLLPWVMAHAWTIGLSVPILVLSLLTPFIVTRAMAKATDKISPSTPTVDDRGILQLPSAFQWNLLVELNGLANTTTNDELRTTIKEIISKIDSTTPLSVTDPLWATLFPYLKSGPAGSRVQTTLANQLLQANPTLAQYELIPPAKSNSLFLPNLKIEEARATQT